MQHHFPLCCVNVLLAAVLALYYYTVEAGISVYLCIAYLTGP